MWESFKNWWYQEESVFSSEQKRNGQYNRYVVYRDTNKQEIVRCKLHNYIIIPQIGSRIKHELINGKVVDCFFDASIDNKMPEKDIDWEYVTVTIMKE